MWHLQGVLELKVEARRLDENSRMSRSLALLLLEKRMRRLSLRSNHSGSDANEPEEDGSFPAALSIELSNLGKFSFSCPGLVANVH